MKQDNNLERIDRGWTEMHSLLDEKMPQRKDGNRLFLWLFFGFLGVVFVVGLNYWNYNTSSQNVVQIDNALNQDNLNDSEYIHSQKLQKEKAIPEIKNESVQEFKTENAIKESISNEILEKNTSQLNKQNKVLQARSLENQNAPLNKGAQIHKLRNKALPENHGIPVVHASEAQVPNTSNLEGFEPQSKQGIIAKNLSSKTDSEKAAMSVFVAQNTVSKINTLPISELNAFKSMPNIEPRLSEYSLSSNRIKFQFGLISSVDYLTSFNTYGLSAGLFGEILVNNTWGVGLYSGYGKSNRKSPEGLRDAMLPDAILTEDSGILIGPDFQLLGNEEVMSSPGSILDNYSVNFNQFTIASYFYFKTNEKSRFSLGLGLEQFSSSNEIISITDENSLSAQGNSVSFIKKTKKTVPYLEPSFMYSMSKHTNIFVSYRYAFKPIIDESDLVAKTHRVRLGISYTF